MSCLSNGVDLFVFAKDLSNESMMTLVQEGGSRKEVNTRFKSKLFTPLKINMEPNNEGLEDGFPSETGDFQVPC